MEYLYISALGRDVNDSLLVFPGNNCYLRTVNKKYGSEKFPLYPKECLY